MWRGWRAWVWMWVWACVGLPHLIHTHSSLYDPHLDPGKAAVLTSHRQQEDGQELSNHVALEVLGGEEAARTIAEKYGFHYVCQVFSDPPVYHLHKPDNTTSHQHRHQNHYHYHYHHHHRGHRSNPDMMQLLADEPDVQWVNLQRALFREKRHQVPQYRPTRDLRQRDTGETPSVAKSGKTSEQGYEEMKRWLNEEELGLPSNVRSSRRTSNDEEERGLSSRNHNSERTPNEEEERELSSNISKRGGTPNEELGVLSNIRDRKGTQNDEELKPSPKTRSSKRTQKEEKLGLSSKNIRRKSITKRSKWREVVLWSAGENDATAKDIYKRKIDGVGEANTIDDSPVFNDPFFKDQWYLHNTGQLGRRGGDINVTGAWRQGYTGKGLTLSILDDGFQTTNADLAANYDASISYSLVRDGQPEDDPSPRLDPPVYSNSHGTYCAGVAAAVANNNVCGVGVAYEAQVGGVRIVDGSVTDVQEATALSRHSEKVAVFSASWGPKDDGAHVEGPERLAKRALELGVQKGRGGLGTIYVWASGNGGVMGDNCNMDGYASSIYTLTVTALTDLGTSTFYGECCASILAGVFVGGTHVMQDAFDRSKTKMRVVVPELDGHCSQRFQGSSAAAPLMAGVVALTLQANPRLGWRDVQHLVVETSEPTAEALEEDGWHTNARGKKFHLLQGFGAVDAGRMVAAALTWDNVGPQKTEHLPLFDGRRSIAPQAWVNVSQELSGPSSLRAVEHVVATVSLQHHQRRLLQVYIISPAGTESQVMTHRPNDNHTTGLHEWPFMSVHLWGEQPEGVWGVAIKSDSEVEGELRKAVLTVYGS